MNTLQSQTPETDIVTKELSWCNCNHFSKLMPLAVTLEKQRDEALALSKAKSEVIATMPNFNELQQERTSLLAQIAVIKQGLEDLKPEKECPFCKPSEPCRHCYTMSTIQGHISHLLANSPVAANEMVERMERMENAIKASIVNFVLYQQGIQMGDLEAILKCLEKALYTTQPAK